MTAGRLTLEDFDTDTPRPREQSAEYRRGFEAGQAEAALSNDAQTAEAILAACAAISDMSFGFAEARVHLIERIRPLMAQVAEAIVPQILQDSFGVHLADSITGDFEAVLSAPFEIAVAPDLCDALTTSLNRDLEADFTITPDPVLLPGQAIVRQGDTHILVDLPALSETLRTALLGLETLERKMAHGE